MKKHKLILSITSGMGLLFAVQTQAASSLSDLEKLVFFRTFEYCARLRHQ
jgi:hypothetical protein